MASLRTDGCILTCSAMQQTKFGAVADILHTLICMYNYSVSSYHSLNTASYCILGGSFCRRIRLLTWTFAPCFTITGDRLLTTYFCRFGRSFSLLYYDPQVWQTYSSTKFKTSALKMGVGGQHHAPAALPPRKTRYSLYRRLGGPQGRCGRVLKISPPP